MRALPHSLLAPLEARLRPLLPHDLYVAAWLDPSPANLDAVFRHLRILQRVLHDYVPRQVSEAPPSPGQIRYAWQEGTLLFTDLAGFTSLLEANAAYGTAGAAALLDVLNRYFAHMIEIVSKSGGDLLEFTGDAMLAQFGADARRNDVARAVRAGLRMQRAMQSFSTIATPQGQLSLGMRIGIHSGRWLSADIGTPYRMERVLLGTALQRTKQAESVAPVGRVCLSPAAASSLGTQFRCTPGRDGHLLAVDDLSDQELGEYELTSFARRAAGPLLLDRSVAGLLREIAEVLALIEPLASYLPTPILALLVESAASRRIAPTFPQLSVVFVNLLGLSEVIDQLAPEEEVALVASFSGLFARIAAAVAAQGGVLKNVTYHLVGPDMLIYFGAPIAHTDDARRAAATALTIRELVTAAPLLHASSYSSQLACQIGIARGPAFAAEIGEPRGRREFNVLGDSVNIAARLMSRAAPNQILVSDTLRSALNESVVYAPLGELALKGRAVPLRVYALDAAKGV
jgi:adenylate cyclase